MDLQTIENALRDIHYPINKQELLQEVEQKGLAELTPLVHQLPQQEFQSVEEVMEKLPLSQVTDDVLKDL